KGWFGLCEVAMSVQIWYRWFATGYRTSLSKARTDPPRYALSGITLYASPLWNRVTDTTPFFKGSITLPIICWILVTICEAIANASIPASGCDAWLDLPSTVMTKISDAAEIGPSVICTSPTGTVDHKCKPST